jgi:hypothetical protein
LDQLAAGRLGDFAGFFEQGAGGARDHGEGRAQIVGHGAEERAPELFGFDFAARALGFFGKLGAFERHGELHGEGVELTPLFEPAEALTVARPQTEHADGASGRRERHVECVAAGQRRRAEPGFLLM